MNENIITVTAKERNTFKFNQDQTEVQQTTTRAARTDGAEDRTVTEKHKTTLEQDERRNSSSETTSTGAMVVPEQSSESITTFDLPSHRFDFISRVDEFWFSSP